MVLLAIHPPWLISAVKWHIIMLICFIFDKSTLKLRRFNDDQTKSWHASKLCSFKAKLKTKPPPKWHNFPQMFNHFKMGTTSLDVWLYPARNYENYSNHLGLAWFWGKITRNTTWISPTHNLHEKNEFKIFISVVFNCQSNNYPSTKRCGVQQDQL